MIALPQEISSCPSLDKLSIEVNRVLDCLILDWEDLDALDHLVEEELRDDVVGSTASTLLSGEAEVDAIFHHKEALLALRSLQTVEKLAVDLGHSPGFDLFFTALLVDEGATELSAHGDVGGA